MAVFSHYGMGSLRWRQEDYEGALEWIDLAAREQDRSGGDWVPEIRQRREQLRSLLGR